MAQTGINIELKDTASDAPDAKLLNNDPHLLGMVTQFYAKAGSGTYLWLILTSGEKGDFVTTNAANIKRQIRLTLEANYDNRPRIIGWCSQANDAASGWVLTTTKTVVKAIETIQNAMFAEGIRFVNVYTSNVDGAQANSASNITDLSTYATPSVAYMPTTTLYNTTVDAQGNITAYTPIKDVGEAIGILSAIQRPRNRRKHYGGRPLDHRRAGQRSVSLSPALSHRHLLQRRRHLQRPDEGVVAAGVRSAWERRVRRCAGVLLADSEHAGPC